MAESPVVNQLDKENRTALHIACACGHFEVVQFLVESKAKLNLCDDQNRSALMKAVQGQHEHCVNILLENHADPNLVDTNGNTALHLTANIPSIPIAVLLLKHKANLNAQNKEGFTPLTVAVREDHMEMTELLLEEGADVNLVDQHQRSPLMIAAGNGQIGMLRMLLHFNADISLKDSKGCSAENYAVMNGHHPCSLLIIEHGTQRNDGSSLSHQDFKDNSQEDDDEAVLIKKKVNLRTMIASKKGEASVLPDRSLSSTESEPECENRVQRIPSFPKALPSNKALQHPVDPSPVSFFSKASQMTSTSLPPYRTLEQSEDQYVQAERRINGLKNSLDEGEKELATVAQKLQQALSASAASDTTIKQLEDAVQRLEIENARLEAAAKQQSNKIDALQKGAYEATMVRGHLEDLVTNLRSSKMTLEDQLSREVQKQSMLSHIAHDSQALWEEELKSRSKLGLRLAELEKEKGELNTQIEMERKKAKKIAEHKKAVDTRLDQEMKRNTELQKEMYRLRTLLKTAKKKLRDQDSGGAEFTSTVSSLQMDLGRHGQAESAIGRMKEKVDDLQVQLEKEVSHHRRLEKVNGELKDQLASFKCSNDLLERSKKQLEEEVLDLRRRMETSQMEQSQVDQFRRDAEERARQELQQKLEQVNLFLQSQAASQEALDQMKATNEATLRSQLQQKISELEGELGRTHTTQQDSLNQRDSLRTEMERFQQLYTEELRLRKSLTAKLERANNRLAEANSKPLYERSRSYMTSSIVNGSLGGPSLDLGTSNYRATLGPLNRSLGLEFSLRSPVNEGQNSRVEDYLAEMRSELDRNISRELRNATVELDVASARLSPVGCASRVELDPVSRATQQYLDVLIKNNMI